MGLSSISELEAIWRPNRPRHIDSGTSRIEYLDWSIELKHNLVTQTIDCVASRGDCVHHFNIPHLKMRLNPFTPASGLVIECFHSHLCQLETDMKASQRDFQKYQGRGYW